LVRLKPDTTKRRQLTPAPAGSATIAC
jgi:hypothetical protein